MVVDKGASGRLTVLQFSAMQRMNALYVVVCLCLPVHAVSLLTHMPSYTHTLTCTPPHKHTPSDMHTHPCIHPLSQPPPPHTKKTHTPQIARDPTRANKLFTYRAIPAALRLITVLGATDVLRLKGLTLLQRLTVPEVNTEKHRTMQATIMKNIMAYTGDTLYDVEGEPVVTAIATQLCSSNEALSERAAQLLRTLASSDEYRCVLWGWVVVWRGCSVEGLWCGGVVMYYDTTCMYYARDVCVLYTCTCVYTSFLHT